MNTPGTQVQSLPCVAGGPALRTAPSLFAADNMLVSKFKEGATDNDGRAGGLNLRPWRDHQSRLLPYWLSLRGADGPASSRNDSVGINHEKCEAHEMMKFGRKRLYSMVTPNGELKERPVSLRWYSFGVFSVFRGGL